MAPTTRRGRARPLSSQHVQPSTSCLINDNHCVKFLLSRRLARSKQTLNYVQYLETGPESGQTVNFRKLKCCFSCTFSSWAATKERHMSSYCKTKSEIKMGEQCFLCRSIVFCQTCTKCLQSCTKSAARDKTESVLGNLGGQTQSSTNVERRVHPTFPNQTNLDQVTHNHQLLCKSPQEPLPVGGIASADKQKCNRIGQKPRISFYNWLFLVPKSNNKWRPILDLSNLNKFLKVEKFKMETPETIRTSLQTGEWVTSIDFKDTYFHIPIQNQSRKYLRFHVQGETYQFKALPFGLSTAPLEFTVVAKEVKYMALQKGIRIHQYLDNWLVWVRFHQICLQHTQTLVALCQDLGWLLNLEKAELDPKQVFDFVGYQFDLKEGKVRATLDWWKTPRTKIRDLLTGLTCLVWQLMSLIGLLKATELTCLVWQLMSLTGLLKATEKQVHLGRLHMRPI